MNTSPALLAAAALSLALTGCAAHEGKTGAATTFASAPHRIASERTITPWYAVPDEALGGLTPNAYVARHQERVMDLVEHYRAPATTAC